MTALARLGNALVARQRGLLIGVLAVLHLALWAQGDVRFGTLCWLVDVGLFMLWQPFVHSERRLGAMSLSSFFVMLAIGVWGFGTSLLLLWSAFLAALVGGRVLFVEHRGTRFFYLLAFSYLLSAILLFILPRLVPNAGDEGVILVRVFLWLGPVLLFLMAVVPVRRELDTGTVGPVDFVYSVFVFLLVAVLSLGALAFMVLRQTGYVEALLGTVLVMAAMLFLLAWAWNPRPGFGGVGVFFSRYLLSVGLPFEQWLHRLTLLAATERDPSAFLDRVLQGMLELPWVEGGRWEGNNVQGAFGRQGEHVQAFDVETLRLTLYTRHRLSPALLWHFRLLTELVAEYYVAKVRERELEQMSYLRAVYETGARLTHDVKNLLQSLNNLLYLAQSLTGERAGEIQPLLLRQLPVIVQRLEMTLEKLRRPRDGAGPLLGAEAWWAELRQRFESEGVEFVADRCLSDAMLPRTLYDSVADNLVQNALDKRLQEPGIRIRVALEEGGAALEVSDTGSPVPGAMVAGLFAAPVASENGLGIGLYHAARQAEAMGYHLALENNDEGNVRFSLRRQA